MCFYSDIHTYVEVLIIYSVLKCAHGAFIYDCTVDLLSLMQHRPADTICD